MTFKEANDIMRRRFVSKPKDDPTKKELRDAIWAFGKWSGDKYCRDCKRYTKCMYKTSYQRIRCNFYKEAKLHDI